MLNPKSLLIALGAVTLLVGSAAGVAIARPDSAVADAERALGFSPDMCRFFQTHGRHALLCVDDDKTNATGDDADRDRRERASWNVTGASVVGKHATFTLDRANGKILSFTSVGLWSDGVVFSSIQLQPANASGGAVATHGDEFVWSNDAWSFVAHDARADGFRVKASNGTVVTLVVPSGVALAVTGNGTGVDLSQGAHRATLQAIGGGSISVNGTSIDVMLPKGAALAFHLGGEPIPAKLAEKREANEDKREAKEDKREADHEERAAGGHGKQG